MSGRMPGWRGRGIDEARAWPGVVVAGLTVSSARMRCTVVVELEVRSVDEWAEEANVLRCTCRSSTSGRVGIPAVGIPADDVAGAKNGESGLNLRHCDA